MVGLCFEGRGLVINIIDEDHGQLSRAVPEDSWKLGLLDRGMTLAYGSPDPI